MLTIRAMVRVGPWIVREVMKQADFTSCQRCGTSIKEIWVCEVDVDSERIRELGGQRVWAIGSTCGPTLLEVSEAEWSKLERPLARRLKLLARIDRLIAASASGGHVLPSVVVQRRGALVDGTAKDREMRHLGLVVGAQMRILGIH